MKNPGTANIVVFLLFFGLALVEAINNQNWIEAALFGALGVVSLWADVRKR